MSEQPAAGWYADPTRRYDHRYWDGATWTEHVSRNGQATTDPLDGGGAAVADGTAVLPSGTSDSSDPGSGPAWQTDSGHRWESTAAAGGSSSWQTQAATATRTNTKAIVSLVLSIIWFGGLASIAAVVLGVMARREIREQPGEGGSGVATAGIVIGVLGIVGAVLILLAFLSLVAIGGSETMFVDMGGA